MVNTIVVKNPVNLERARDKLEKGSLLENKTANDTSLEYKDSTGKLWRLPLQEIPNVKDLPEALKNKMIPLRYSIAVMRNGWQVLHGPFFDITEALRITPEIECVILEVKGNKSEIPIYAYDGNDCAWKQIK